MLFLITFIFKMFKYKSHYVCIDAHLIAGALEYKVALLNEIKGEFEVQVGPLAQSFEVPAEFAEGGVVHLAVQRNVVLDLRTAVDAVQDVALQVLVDGVVLLQAVQGDAVKRQRVGNLLQNHIHQVNWIQTMSRSKMFQED